MAADEDSAYGCSQERLWFCVLLETRFKITEEIRECGLPSHADMPLPHFELTRKIIGAAFKVHNELGHGYSEKIYRRAFAIVLREKCAGGGTALLVYFGKEVTHKRLVKGDPEGECQKFCVRGG